MSTVLIASASFVSAFLAVVALSVLGMMAMQAAAERETPRMPWLRVSLLTGAAFLAFGVLLALAFGGLDVIDKRRAQADMKTRQTLYDACLTRTTADVCEIHWVRLRKPARDGGGPILVITPDGKIGTGLGL